MELYPVSVFPSVIEVAFMIYTAEKVWPELIIQITLNGIEYSH